eukprot:360963-Chlamydomonas_euryale.AAC.4
MPRAGGLSGKQFSAPCLMHTLLGRPPSGLGNPQRSGAHSRRPWADGAVRTRTCADAWLFPLPHPPSRCFPNSCHSPFPPLCPLPRHVLFPAPVMSHEGLT